VKKNPGGTQMMPTAIMVKKNTLESSALHKRTLNISFKKGRITQKVICLAVDHSDVRAVGLN